MVRRTCVLVVIYKFVLSMGQCLGWPFKMGYYRVIHQDVNQYMFTFWTYNDEFEDDQWTRSLRKESGAKIILKDSRKVFLSLSRPWKNLVLARIPRVWNILARALQQTYHFAENTSETPRDPIRIFVRSADSRKGLSNLLYFTSSRLKFCCPSTTLVNAVLIVIQFAIKMLPHWCSWKPVCCVKASATRRWGMCWSNNARRCKFLRVVTWPMAGLLWSSSIDFGDLASLGFRNAS